MEATPIDLVGAAKDLDGAAYGGLAGEQLLLGAAGEDCDVAGGVGGPKIATFDTNPEGLEVTRSGHHAAEGRPADEGHELAEGIGRNSGCIRDGGDIGHGGEPFAQGLEERSLVVSAASAKRVEAQDQAVVLRETEIGGVDEEDGTARQPGAPEQKDAEGKLDHNEDVRRPGAALDDAVLTPFQKRQQVLAPGAQGRCEGEDERAENSECQRVNGDAPIGCDVGLDAGSRFERRDQRGNRAPDPPCEGPGRRGGGDRKHEAFRKQQGQDAASRGAERLSNGELSAAGGGTSQHQVRDVRAHHQQGEQGHAGEDRHKHAGL